MTGRADSPAKAEVPTRQLILTPASEIEPEPVIWAWEDDNYGRIPAGSLGLFAGREGTGKSSFLIYLTAKITRGTLPGSFQGHPKSVIYVAVEDSWKHTIVPRLIAAGADLSRVYRAEVHNLLHDATVSLSLPSDNDMLKAAITGNNVVMVALDPLMSAISDTLDTHVNRQVRQALDPLARIADETGAVFAGIAHFNKSSSTDASSLITASGAFKDVARYIFAFAASDEADGTQVITQTKNSLGHSDLPSLAYRIIEATVETKKGDTKVGKLVLDGASELSVRDILIAHNVGGTSQRDEKTRAEEYLKTVLANGPKLTRDVEEEARQAHSINARTLDRARHDLKVKARKIGKEWHIYLPEHEGDLADLQPAETAKNNKDDKNATPRDLGAVGTLDAGKNAKNANPPYPGTLGTLIVLDGTQYTVTDRPAPGPPPRIPAAQGRVQTSPYAPRSS